MPAVQQPMSLARLTYGRRGTQGFSLIEVLVAIGMVALALTAGLSASMGLSRQAERETEVLLAHWCAHNALTALRLARQWPDAGSSTQTCTQAGRELAVRLTVQTTASADFRQANVQVLPADSAADGRRADVQVLLSVSTLVGRY